VRCCFGPCCATGACSCRETSINPIEKVSVRRVALSLDQASGPTVHPAPIPRHRQWRLGTCTTGRRICGREPRGRRRVNSQSACQILAPARGRRERGEVTPRIGAMPCSVFAFLPELLCLPVCTRVTSPGSLKDCTVWFLRNERPNR
jgi:hypothetical protein